MIKITFCGIIYLFHMFLLLGLEGFTLLTPNSLPLSIPSQFNSVFIVTSVYLTSILMLSSKLCPSYFFFCCIFSDVENKIGIAVFEGIIRIFRTERFLYYKEARTDCPTA